MDRKFLLNLLLFVTFFIPILIYLVHKDIKRRKQLTRLQIEYPMFRIEEDVSGIITAIRFETANNDPNSSYITINNSLKRRITAGFEVRTDSVLDSILKIGDHIYKKGGSSQFEILKIKYSDSTKFQFELANDLGYPLK